MNNGFKDPQIPRTNGRVFSGNKFWALSQAVIGPLVVAAIVGLVYWGLGLRADLDRAVRAVERNRTMLVYLEEEVNDLLSFRFEGDRFTKADGKDLEKALRSIEHELHELQIKYAELPQSIPFPFTDAWQNRILENERNITAVKSTLEAQRK